MAYTKVRFRCGQCEQTEERCACDRFCYLCMGQFNVRLCEDGLYYCQPCREACEYRTDE